MFYSAPSGGDVGGGRFLVMSEVRQAAVFSMELNGSKHTRYPLPSLYNPVAVAFEPFSKSIFVTERGSASAASPKTIIKYSIDNANGVKRSLPRSKYFLVSKVTFGTILSSRKDHLKADSVKAGVGKGGVRKKAMKKVGDRV